MICDRQAVVTLRYLPCYHDTGGRDLCDLSSQREEGGEKNEIKGVQKGGRGEEEEERLVSKDYKGAQITFSPTGAEGAPGPDRIATIGPSTSLHHFRFPVISYKVSGSNGSNVTTHPWVTNTLRQGGPSPGPDAVWPSPGPGAIPPVVFCFLLMGTGSSFPFPCVIVFCVVGPINHTKVTNNSRDCKWSCMYVMGEGRGGNVSDMRE